jgi:pimeloyl-ACP methyl ester carboxylesterase
MKSVFKDEQSKELLLTWFDRFKSRVPVATESRVVKTRFGETHVLVSGRESAPGVVLLHGALASSAHVLRELASLTEAFRVYAVDIVGQSVKSADARPSVSNNDYGVWLSDVLDGLSLERAHVVGVSWGGFVAIRLAASAPHRIQRLVLLVPAGVVKSPFWGGLTRVGLPMLRYRLSPSEKSLRGFVRNLLTTTDDDWTPYLGDAVRSYNMDMRIPALARPEELQGFARRRSSSEQTTT